MNPKVKDCAKIIKEPLCVTEELEAMSKNIFVLLNEHKYIVKFSFFINFKMSHEYRGKLNDLKKECLSFASQFNNKCEEFFNNISLGTSEATNYFNTIHELKIKSHDNFFEEAKISKNACNNFFYLFL